MAVEMPSASRLKQPIKFSRPSRSSATMPKSPADRLWMIGGGVAAAFILLIAYVAFIGPQRSSTSEVQSQSADAQHHITSLQARIATLRSQSKDLPKYQRELAAARAALPADSGVSTLLRTMQQIGSSTSTSVSAFTVGVPTAVVAPVAAGATPSAAPTAAAAAPTASAYSMSISTQVTGAPSNLNRFLVQLQQVQPRAVLITQLTEGAASATSDVAAGTTALSLTMLAFIAPSTTTDPSAAAGS